MLEINRNCIHKDMVMNNSRSQKKLYNDKIIKSAGIIPRWMCTINALIKKTTSVLVYTNSKHFIHILYIDVSFFQGSYLVQIYKYQRLAHDK